MGEVSGVIIKFLVLSVMFKVAMTLIFNWHFFLKHFEGKGVKTPLTVGLAFLVFWSYDLDIIRDLLKIWDSTINLSLGGQFITALLIAGGSDGVFRIFTKLGIRNPAESEEKAAEMRKSEEPKN